METIYDFNEGNLLNVRVICPNGAAETQLAIDSLKDALEIAIRQDEHFRATTAPVAVDA